jgi:hypothetical protein
MWPISWGESYTALGGQEFETFSSPGDEAGSNMNNTNINMAMARPGGLLAVAQVSTSDTSRWPEADPSNETYWIIGDRESLLFMMSNLVDRCHVTPQWPRLFDPKAVNGTRPENVIQYYRASSFALAHLSFNNSLTSTTSDWAPLPAPLDTSRFLKCINGTIGSALPIMDSINRSQKPVGAAAVVAALIGGLMLIYGLYALTSMWFNRREKRKVEAMRARERENGEVNIKETEGTKRLSKIEERPSHETEESEERARQDRFLVVEEVRRGYGP